MRKPCLHTRIQTILFAVRVICLKRDVQEATRANASKERAGYSHSIYERRKPLSEPNPSRRCLCFHRIAASEAAGYGERGRGEQQETPGQQPSLFFYFLSIPLLHRSPRTPAGCAALRRSRCINSPLQRPQVCISAVSACFAIPAELLSGKENALPFSLKAV